MSKVELGELLYEYTLSITGLTEFGVSFQDLLSGKALPPPEGARFDVAFAGSAVGDKLSGTVTGVDYLFIRADGRSDLDIHATITTTDGKTIALKADGVSLPREGSPILDLKENVKLFSAYEEYRWVNPLQVWGIGTVDLATQVINIKGYCA